MMNMAMQQLASAACCASVFLALSLPLAAQETVSEAKAADPIGALVPADAVAVARLGPISQTEAKVKRLVAAFSKDFAEFVDVGVLMDGLGLPVEIDRSKPAAIALRINPAGVAPLVTFILPVEDAAGVAEMLADAGFPSPPVALGSFVAFSPDGEYEPGQGRCRLLERLAASDASLAVDLDKLVGAYREFIDMPMGEAESAVSMAAAMWGDGMGGMVEGMLAQAKAFIDAVDTLDLRLDTDGNEATIRMGLDVKPDSSFSSMQWSQGARFDHLLPALSANHPVSMMLSMDLQGFFKWYGSFLESMSAAGMGMEPEQFDEFKKIMDLSAKGMEGVGSNLAFSFGMDKQGMALSQALDAKEDPVKTMGLWSDLYKDPVWKRESGMEIALGELEKRGDLHVLPMSVVVDWEKLLSMDPNIEAFDPEMASAVVSKLLGSEDGSIHSAMFARDKVIGYILGAKARVDSEVEAMGPWKTRNDHGAWALAKAGGESAFVLSMDFQGVMLMAKEFASVLGAGDEVPAIRQGSPAPVAMFAGARGRRITLGASTRVDDLARVVRQLMRGSRR